MQYINFFFIIILFVSITSCHSTQSAGSTGLDKKAKREKAPKVEKVYSTLAERLRETPGVLVTGQGRYASVRIVGIPQTINSSNEPLFIVDGQKIGRSFAQVENIINVMEVDKIRVLKTAADTGLYGLEGANGVILIKMKK